MQTKKSPQKSNSKSSAGSKSNWQSNSKASSNRKSSSKSSANASSNDKANTYSRSSESYKANGKPNSKSSASSSAGSKSNTKSYSNSGSKSITGYHSNPKSKAYAKPSGKASKWDKSKTNDKFQNGSQSNDFYDLRTDAVKQFPKITPPCPIFHECGGCKIQDIAYDNQLAFKQKEVERLLGRFGKVEPIIGMKSPERYRNKLHASYGYDKKRGVYSGIYAEYSHDIVPVEDCMIQNQVANKILVTLSKLVNDFKLTIFNEDTQKGFLRHVLIRNGYHSGEIMVVLVTGTPVFPSKNNFISALLKAHPEITTVVMNINAKRTSMVLGDQEKVLYGNGYILDTLCQKTFKISPKSFYQINTEQTEILYGKAIEYAGLTGKETLLDAYCGIGTIGIIASDQASFVVGVELNQSAVKDAIQNARKNKVDNIRFYQADAGQFMIDVAEAGESIDVVMMDPPRSGSDTAFLSSVVKLSPSRVVYVSCNPETQARDLDYLVKKGYQVEAIQPVDMFPHTGHVECCVLLKKK